MNRYIAFTTLCILELSLPSIKISAQPKNYQLDFQGHRGCRGLYPENTVTAMIEAVKMGVTTLEMDVVITKDKQVVLSHEPFMAHEIATSPEGTYLTELDEKIYNIYQMNYEELKHWDVGLKPHPKFPNQIKMAAYKPLLSDLIDSVENYIYKNNLKPVQYNIETKSSPNGDRIFHPEPKEFVRLLVVVLQHKKIINRTIIQSFDKRTIQLVHQEKTPVKTAYLLEKSNRKSIVKQLDDLGFNPDIVSPEYSGLNKKYVDYCHLRGIKVIPWTVNKAEEIVKLINDGVDGIISDYPNLFQLKKLN